MQMFLLCFVPMFVAIDPPGLLPVFASITAGYPAHTRRKLTLQAVPTALAIGVIFFVIGRPLLNFLNIAVHDLQIAGGALLFVYAMMDLILPGKPMVHEEQSIGIVPLATPLIVGPATLTLGLVLMDKFKDQPWLPLGALVLNLAIVAVCMLGIEQVLRFVPINAMRAISKVVDLLLAAIGVSFIREGILEVIRIGVRAKGGY